MNQDRSTQILFALVFIGVPALYVFWRIVPLLIFYVMPLVLVSCLLAGIWMAGLAATDEDYSWLALFIPLTAVLVFFVAWISKSGACRRDRQGEHAYRKSIFLPLV